MSAMFKMFVCGAIGGLLLRDGSVLHAAEGIVWLIASACYLVALVLQTLKKGDRNGRPE